MPNPLQRSARTRIALAAAACAALLAGCTAGPDFRQPAVPDSAQVPTQHQAAAIDMAAPWWHQLGSPPLNTLIDQALAASPMLERRSGPVMRVAGAAGAEVEGKMVSDTAGVRWSGKTRILAQGGFAVPRVGTARPAWLSWWVPQRPPRS